MHEVRRVGRAQTAAGARDRTPTPRKDVLGAKAAIVIDVVVVVDVDKEYRLRELEENGGRVLTLACQRLALNGLVNLIGEIQIVVEVRILNTCILVIGEYP